MSTNAIWASQNSKPPCKLYYDVIVYGATMGGIMAAIAAKKMGASVAIFEPFGWIGGMVTGGLAFSDLPGGAQGTSQTYGSSLSMSSAALVGLAHDFWSDVAQEYGVTLQSMLQFATINAEPKRYQTVVRRWLGNYGIDVFLFAQMTSVQGNGAVTTGLQSITLNFLNAGGVQTIQCSKFVDATYEGDLVAQCLPASSIVIGREANATYGETHNGVRLSLIHI